MNDETWIRLRAVLADALEDLDLAAVRRKDHLARSQAKLRLAGYTGIAATGPIFDDEHTRIKHDELVARKRRDAVLLTASLLWPDENDVPALLAFAARQQVSERTGLVVR